MNKKQNIINYKKILIYYQNSIKYCKKKQEYFFINLLINLIARNNHKIRKLNKIIRKLTSKITE